VLFELGIVFACFVQMLGELVAVDIAQMSVSVNILHLHKMPIGIIQNKIRITKALHVHPNILIVLQIDFL
jgi:hypothetical protein